MGLLDNLLGKGQSEQQLQGFVNQYEQGRPEEGYSDQDVLNHYMNVAPNLSHAQYLQAAEQAFDRMSPQQRQEFGQFMEQQAQQRGVNLGGLGQQMGSSNFQNNPNLLAQMAGMFHSQDPGLLGTIASAGLGAAMGGGSGGALGSILGGVMGGGHQTSNMGGGSGLLSNPAAKAALAGIAAMAIKQAMGGGAGSRR